MTLIKLADEHIPPRLVDFYDELALHDYQARQQEHPRFQRVVDLVCATARTYDLKTCLEIGCAEGIMTALIAPAFDEIFAADISPALIDKALTAGRHKRRGTHFVVMNVETTHLEGLGPFDLIVMSEVLEHLYEPTHVVARCLRMSKYLVASCPINEQPNPDAFDVALYGVEQKWADATGHIWAMDEAGFKGLFDGYEIVHFETVLPCGIAVVKGGR